MSKSHSFDEQEVLTEDEQELFERLADRYDGEDVGRIFELALQSSDSGTDNEEASS